MDFLSDEQKVKFAAINAVFQERRMGFLQQGLDR